MWVLEFYPFKMYRLNAGMFERAKTEAAQVVSEVEKLYPPNASGLSRILPWNWRVEPIIPEINAEAFEFIRRLARSRHPYNLLLNTFDINKLPTLLPPQTIKGLEGTVQALHHHYPSLSSMFEIIFPLYSWPALALLLFYCPLTILLIHDLGLRRLGLSEIGLRTPGVNPGVKARSRRLQVFVQRF